MELTINDKIRMLRQFYRLSQTEFANRIGAKLITVWSWENKKRTPTADSVEKIEKEFNVNLDTFEIAYQPMNK